ncbi:MAG: polysaccharide biosynthesis/export family protein [Candidatus Omnitrophota bacterium]
MLNKTIPALIVSLGVLISSFLSLARAEDKAQAPAEAAALAPEIIPASAVDSEPEKEGYTLAIPNNIAGYEAIVPASSTSEFDSVKYTLGPDDVIEILVMRHPEFSGTFPINSEGKIQYKFVGDIDVKKLAKKQLEEKIVKILSSYLLDPEVSVTIIEYRSKFVFVLGEVSQPGKYYIKSETITVRDAIVTSGLPTYAAAMRKCSLITPDKSGKVKNKPVNIYNILYGGDLRKNIDMFPGDVLYVPSTVMAKIIRVISPVAATVGLASSSTDGSSAVKTGAKTMLK